MATLSELVEGLAYVTRIPEATVFAYGRFAREAGAINQKGRGRAAAEMSATDAANLLIAVGGTAVTREAGDAVRRYRPMRGSIYDFSRAPIKDVILTWLKPLGLLLDDQHETGPEFRLKADFGEFMEFLLVEAATGGLQRLLRRIPAAEIPDDLLASWIRTDSEHLDEDVDDWVEKGLVQLKAPDEIRFGEDVELAITFVRTYPRVDVEFKRMWRGAETVFQVTFYPARSVSAEIDALRVAATLTQHAIFGVAWLLSNQLRPEALRGRGLLRLDQRLRRGGGAGQERGQDHPRGKAMTSKLRHLERVGENVENDIRRCGRSVLCIVAEADARSFAYTIGNWIVGLPELLIIGTAKGALLNDLSQMMIARGAAFADGELVNLGGKYPAKIIDADQRAQAGYTIQAGQYHGHEHYRVQQVLMPDRNGRFPDDPECQRPYSTLPVLRRP